MKKDYQNIDYENDEILKLVSDFHVPVAKSTEELWENIHQKLSKNKVKNNHLIPKIVLSIAAMIVLFLGISLILNNENKEIILNTEMAQIQEFEVGNNIRLTLNAKSIVKYEDTSFVQLVGEAYFEVKKGTPFTVSTNTGLVKVHGTRFNVYSYDSLLKVICYEGVVSVHKNNSTDSILLYPGDEYLNNKTEKHKLDSIYLIPSWKKGEFYFNNEPLGIVFRTIEMQYGVTISSQIDTKKTYTGYFKNDNLKNALDLISIPMNLEYNILDSKKIQIKTKN